MQALSWLDHNHPDLIITDYRMPEMNGIELIRQVRSRPACQDIPIMMITVVSERSVRYDALEAGATAFLTRPIDQIECRTSCRNLLKLHEQQTIIPGPGRLAGAPGRGSNPANRVSRTRNPVASGEGPASTATK